jgi:N utilization substance protein A
MRVTLSDAARQYIALFEDVTGATARDCVILDGDSDDGPNGADDGGASNANRAGDADGSNGGSDGGDARDRVLFLVKPGEMGQAIGSGGDNVRRVEDRLDKEVTLVEDADTAEAFVANALAPAAVYNVTISEDEETIAYAEVDSEDTGIAIGENGRNIAAAETLAKRHYDVDDIQLT